MRNIRIFLIFVFATLLLMHPIYANAASEAINGTVKYNGATYSTKYIEKDRQYVIIKKENGKNSIIKKLPKGKNEPNDWEIDAISGSYIILTCGNFYAWKTWCYKFNIKDKKLVKIKDSCSLGGVKESFAWGSNEFRTDVSPRKVTLYKISSNGDLEEIRVLDKRVNTGTPIFITNKWFYAKDGDTHNELYCCNVDGSNERMLGSFMKDDIYQAVYYNFDEFGCEVTIGDDTFYFTFPKDVFCKDAISRNIDVRFGKANKNSSAINLLQDVHYEDSFFMADNTAYNLYLSKISLASAMTTINHVNKHWDDSYLRKLLVEQLEFDNYRAINKNKKINNEANKVAFSIANKRVLIEGKITTILNITVRSGDYGGEWTSNFRCMGKDGNDKLHYGFSKAAESALGEIEKYMVDNSIDADSVKVWISGFSRGAAVSNLLGRMMVDNNYVKSGNLYCYTFATPSVTKNKSSQRGIFNTINPIDVVPKVPPTFWSYGSYGTTYYLPFATNDKDYFNQMLPEIKKSYKRIKGDSYGIYANHYVSLKTLMQTLNIAVGGTEWLYYKTSQSDICRISGETLAKTGEKKSVSKLMLYLFLRIKREKFIGVLNLKTITTNLGLLSTASDTQLFTDLGSNDIRFTNLADQHQPVAYWALLEHGILHDSAEDKMLSIACPVDVTVFDESDRVVARVINDKYDDYITNNKDKALNCYVDDNGTKLIYLPADGNYRVEIKATDDGVMDYSVTEFNAEEAVARRVYYQDIPLTSGEEFTATINKGFDNSPSGYNLSSSTGKTISNYTVINGSSSNNINIDANAGDNGAVLGTQNLYTVGDSVVFRAVPNQDYSFVGWYEDEQLIERNRELGFIVSESDNNRKITARFSKIKPSLPAVKILKPKAGKKAATIRWKKVAKNNLKSTKKIQIIYSTDKRFQKNVYVKYASAKKASLKIKGLKSKKKYYVRIRAYTERNDRISISKWSATKAVKVK